MSGDFVMDTSRLPADSRAPLIAGILGAVSLVIPAATLHHVATSPRDGANAPVFRIMLVAWTLLVISDLALIGYSFLTPRCPNVYMHVFPCYTREPCAANALFALGFVARALGDYLCTIAMFRRFQPVLRTFGNAAFQRVVRGSPVLATACTLLSLTWIVSVAVEHLPSPSDQRLPPAVWVRSWGNHLTLLLFGVTSFLCYLPAIVYVKRALNEVDKLLARQPQKFSPGGALSAPSTVDSAPERQPGPGSGVSLEKQRGQLQAGPGMSTGTQLQPKHSAHRISFTSTSQPRLDVGRASFTSASQPRLDVDRVSITSSTHSMRTASVSASAAGGAVAAASVAATTSARGSGTIVLGPSQSRLKLFSKLLSFSQTNISLVMLERRLWLRAYVLLLGCVSHFVVAVVNILDVIPGVKSQPVVLQTMVIHLLFKSYLSMELFLIVTMKRALEINRQRTSTLASVQS